MRKNFLFIAAICLSMFGCNQEIQKSTPLEFEEENVSIEQISDQIYKYTNENLGLDFEYPAKWGIVTQDIKFDDVDMQIELSFENNKEAKIITQSSNYFYPAFYDNSAIFNTNSRALQDPSSFCLSYDPCLEERDRSKNLCHLTNRDGCYEELSKANLLNKKTADSGYTISSNYYALLKGEIFASMTININLGIITETYNKYKDSSYYGYKCESEECTLEAKDKYIEYLNDKKADEIEDFVKTIQIFEPNNQTDWYQSQIRKHYQIKKLSINPEEIYKKNDPDDDSAEIITPEREMEIEMVLQYYTGAHQEVQDSFEPMQLKNTNEIFQTICAEDEFFFNVSNSKKNDLLGIRKPISEKIQLGEEFYAFLRIPKTQNERKDPYRHTNTYLDFVSLIPNKSTPPALRTITCNDVRIYYFKEDRMIVNLGRSYETPEQLYLWDGQEWKTLYDFVKVGNPVTLGEINSDKFVIKETRGCCDMYFPRIPNNWTSFVVDTDSLEIVDVIFRKEP